MAWHHKLKQTLAQKCSIYHPKWRKLPPVLLVIQNLRYPSHTGKRHLPVKSWNRPCGHLCFYFEERFNLQIPCQQVDLPVAVAGIFFRCRVKNACKKAGAPLKLKDQIEASYCLELGLKRQDCIISLFDESPRSLLFFIPFPCEFFGPKFWNQGSK